MHRLSTEQVVLVVIQTTALVALSVRVAWNGLYRSYPYFFGYLLAELLQSAVLTFVPDRAYVYAWMATEGFIVCFYALIVLECYTVTLRDLPGLASLSRRYIRIVLGIAIVIALLLLGLEKAPNGNVSRLVIFERVIATSLVIFVLLMLGYLVYYPVRLSRNAIAYSAGYSVYFLAKATLLFTVNRTHAAAQLLATVMIGVYTLCLLFWLVTLNERGEEKTLVVGHRWKPGDDAAVLAKLQAINDSLSRAGKT